MTLAIDITTCVHGRRTIAAGASKSAYCRHCGLQIHTERIPGGFSWVDSYGHAGCPAHDLSVHDPEDTEHPEKCSPCQEIEDEVVSMRDMLASLDARHINRFVNK